MDKIFQQDLTKEEKIGGIFVRYVEVMASKAHISIIWYAALLKKQKNMQ